MDKKKGLIISAILAVLAALLLMKYAADLRAELGYDRMETLVCAKVDLPKGAIINRAQSASRRVPASFTHPKAVRMSDLDTVLGRKLSSDLKPGQPLLWNDLTGGEVGAERLSDLVQVGLRALTIPVDPKFALSGMVKPSDRVDMLLTYTDRNEERKTTTVLQNILVAAVGSEMGIEAESAASRDRSRRSAPNNITVMATPEQAELIVYTVDRGKIAMTLRSRSDLDLLELASRDFSTLIGEPTARPGKKPVKRRHDPLPEVLDLLNQRR